MYVCGECGERAETAGSCHRDGQPLAKTDDPLLGTMVGRYRLARVLGEGGMGRVYAAMQPDLGSRVAIKVVADKHADNPVQLDRFFAEARAVNLIRHENIVNVIDLDRLPDGRPVIVMELIEGQTLRSIVRAGFPPIGGVLQAMIEVLGAIAAAHAIGIVHRDLKPDNILVTASGRAKVLDFGIAKLAVDLPGQVMPRTGTGVVMGTPEYMAPEQIDGGTVDARCDLYAVGVVLFEAITRQLPFAGRHGYQLLRAHIEEPPPSPRGLRPELPEALERVILTALAKQRGQRYESAHAMANALHAAAEDLPVEQWRPLTPTGRLFPRSAEPPAPRKVAVTADTGPMIGIGTPTLRERPASRRAPREPSVHELSTQVPAREEVTRDELRHVAKDAPPPTAQHEPRRRSRALVPVLAALAGAGAVAAVVVLRSPSAPAPTPTPSPSPTPTPPISYMPAEFDVIGNLSHAQQAAAKRFPGAILTELSFQPLFPDGLVKNATGAYLFTSPDGQHCVAVMPSMAVLDTKGCAQGRLVAPPHCTLAEVWARSYPGVTTSSRGAIVTWAEMAGRPTWSLVPIGGGGSPAVIPDDCGATPAPGPRQDHEPAQTLHGSPIARAPPTAPEDLEVYADAHDFDPHHFDPVAYLPNAKALARKIVPDVELAELESPHVMASGLLPPGRFVSELAKYRFVSPARAKTDHDTRQLHPCVIDVEVDHRRARAVYNTDELCTAVEAAPRCTAAQIWAKAIADGIPSNQVAELIYARGAWTHNPSGYVEQGDLSAPSGINGPIHTYRDECTAAPHPAAAPVESTPPPETTGEFTDHLPGDPMKFDVVHYVDAARELARKLDSDADLHSIYCAGDGPTGFTSLEGACTYAFWSAKRAHAVHDRDHQPMCEVEVAVHPTGLVSVRRRVPLRSAECATETIEDDPTCTLDRVWAQAAAQGANPGDDWVGLTLVDGTWQLDGTDHKRKARQFTITCR